MTGALIFSPDGNGPMRAAYPLRFKSIVIHKEKISKLKTPLKGCPKLAFHGTYHSLLCFRQRTKEITFDSEAVRGTRARPLEGGRRE
jgi:hypothetical protein